MKAIVRYTLLSLLDIQKTHIQNIELTFKTETVDTDGRK